MRAFLLVLFTVFTAVLFCQSPAHAEDGVTPDRILVGVSNVQKGQAGFLGQELLKGASAYLSHINDTGGVHGRTIQLVALNDSYDPIECIDNTKKLLDVLNVFLLFGYVGTPTTQAVLPLVNKRRIPFMFPFTGASLLRDTHKAPTVFNLRASYEQETRAMVEYLAKAGKKRLAVFFQDDSFGLNGLFGVMEHLKEFPSMKLVAKACYKRGTTAVNSALISILEAKPDAVILVGTYKPCAEFIKRAKSLGLRDAIFMNISFVGSKALAQELGDAGNGVLVTQVVPLPWDTSVSAVAEYQQLMLASDPLYQPGFVSLEGFLNAKLLVRLLQKTGPQLTRESLLHSVRNAYDINLGLGADVCFTPMDNQGQKRVYITRIANDTFETL